MLLQSEQTQGKHRYVCNCTNLVTHIFKGSENSKKHQWLSKHHFTNIGLTCFGMLALFTWKVKCLNKKNKIDYQPGLRKMGKKCILPLLWCAQIRWVLGYVRNFWHIRGLLLSSCTQIHLGYLHSRDLPSLPPVKWWLKFSFFRPMPNCSTNSNITL